MTILTTILQVTQIEEIGQDGANSKVFKVHDPQLDAILALKELQIENFENIDNYFQEARMLQNAKHNHVAEIKFCSRDHEKIYIAMPFYQNGSLKNLLDLRFLKIREVIKIAIHFLSGLHHLHVKELIHFDLKPSNILFDDSGKALVSDFGLTKYVNDFGIAEQDMIYGKHFVPEYFRGIARSNLADIYQSGLVLYRMCNGEKAFNDEWNLFYREGMTIDQLVDGLKNERFPKREYKPHVPLSLTNYQ